MNGSKQLRNDGFEHPFQNEIKNMKKSVSFSGQLASYIVNEQEMGS